MAAAGVLLALVAFFLSLVEQPPEHLEKTFDILTPQAGPLAHDLRTGSEGRPQPKD